MLNQVGTEYPAMMTVKGESRRIRWIIAINAKNSAATITE